MYIECKSPIFEYKLSEYRRFHIEVIKPHFH